MNPEKDDMSAVSETEACITCICKSCIHNAFRYAEMDHPADQSILKRKDGRTFSVQEIGGLCAHCKKNVLYRNAMKIAFSDYSEILPHTLSKEVVCQGDSCQSYEVGVIQS